MFGYLVCGCTWWFACLVLLVILCCVAGYFPDFVGLPVITLLVFHWLVGWFSGFVWWIWIVLWLLLLRWFYACWLCACWLFCGLGLLN